MTYVEELEQLFRGVREPITIVFRRPTISKPETKLRGDLRRVSGAARRNPRGTPRSISDVQISCVHFNGRISSGSRPQDLSQAGNAPSANKGRVM